MKMLPGIFVSAHTPESFIIVARPNRRAFSWRIEMTFLSYKDLRKKGIRFSRVHVLRMVKAGRFPKPVKLGDKENSWIEVEVDKWLTKRVEARGGEYETAPAQGVK
jgi:prophage regulatory protein